MELTTIAGLFRLLALIVLTYPRTIDDVAITLAMLICDIEEAIPAVSDIEGDWQPYYEVWEYITGEVAVR